MNTRKIKKFLAHGMLLATFLVSGVAFADSGLSAGNIQPDEYSGNIPDEGTAVCFALAELGYFVWSDDIVGFKVDSPDADDEDAIINGYGDGYVTVTISEDGKYLDWTATNATMLAVLVKGGNGYHVYDYDETGLNSDTELHSPLNNGGNVPNISHYNGCYIPHEVSTAQWCSPGYWRQVQHLGSWPATGYSPDDLYIDAIGVLDFKPKKGTSPNMNPTLWEVLQSPDVYGGAAFNAVGDLLSAAHPDVDFQGDRVEDSCPLGRDEG